MLRPRIAISACLLGHKVRYDGGHKTDAWIIESLGAKVDWIAVCPEVEAGLGLPREPIDRHEDGESRRVLGSLSGRDYTSDLIEAAQRLLWQLQRADGHILKARSPSCGWMDTPILGSDDAHAQGDGLYVEILRSRHPRMPLITEAQLQDSKLRGSFLEAVRLQAEARLEGTETLPHDWAE